MFFNKIFLAITFSVCGVVYVLLTVNEIMSKIKLLSEDKLWSNLVVVVTILNQI